MSTVDDAGHYFQTTDSIATTARKAAKSKNKHGRPIKRPSKILAIAADLRASSSSSGSDRHVVLVAEAAGDVSRVDLENNSAKRVLSEPTAPVTCVALHEKTRTLFGGCWNKQIYYKSLATAGSAASILTGHADFVKCLLATSLGGQPILVSGGADATIIVWAYRDGEGYKLLHKLKGHTKSLQDLAIDPTSQTESEDSFVLFSASSDREIRRWHISLDSAHETPESLSTPILAHETSVYKLCFDSDGDLWTASADKTAKHLVRDRDWQADTVLQHPDFVRDVAVSEQLGLVVTACRDEEVRVWDAAAGDLVCTYTGHYEEVTGLLVLGRKVVSVSIDGTVRQWSLERREMAKYLEDLEKEREGVEEPNGEKQSKSLLTAEEEAELAELLDED